jgi:hypothetical protein
MQPLMLMLLPAAAAVRDFSPQVVDNCQCWFVLNQMDIGCVDVTRLTSR